MNIKFDHEKFREVRKQKCTQNELADAVDTTDRYIRDLESGKKHNPSAILLYKLTQELHQPMEGFFLAVPEESEDGDA